jgi:hypothetical protein
MALTRMNHSLQILGPIDDGPYFTNNEGIPFPDPSHSKTAGGLPLVSDAFLLGPIEMLLLLK